MAAEARGGGRMEIKKTLQAILDSLQRMNDKIDKATDRIGSQLEQVNERP